jgi:hypothetical protein
MRTNTTSAMLRRSSILSALAAAVAIVAGGGSAAGDCCVGQSPARIGFHVHFRDPVVLQSVVRGGLTSDALANYVATAHINAGPRTIVRPRPQRGQSTRDSSPLRFNLSRQQLRTIRETAHSIGRAPILYVSVKGVLTGDQTPSYGSSHFNITLKRR